MRTHSRIKSVVLWLAIGAAVAYFAQSQHQKVISREKREAAEVEKTQQMLDALRAIASRHKAKVDWAREVSGGRSTRLSPLMSAELQQVWQTGSPVMFAGMIKDISKNDDGSYQVLLHYASISEAHSFLSNELYLNARCNAEQTAPLLKIASQDSRLGLFPDAIIVGIVGAVLASKEQSSDGTTAALTGIASCIETVPLAQDLPISWASQVQPK